MRAQSDLDNVLLLNEPGEVEPAGSVRHGAEPGPLPDNDIDHDNVNDPDPSLIVSVNLWNWASFTLKQGWIFCKNRGNMYISIESQKYVLWQIEKDFDIFFAILLDISITFSFMINDQESFQLVAKYPLVPCWRGTSDKILDWTDIRGGGGV